MSGDESKPEEALRAVLERQGVTGASVEPAVPAVVSPVHRGVAHHCWRVEVPGGDRLFCKLPAADQAQLLADADAARMARLAGDAGIAPAVAWFDEDSSILATAWLGEGWRYAKVEDLRQPETLSAVIGLLTRFHGQPVAGLPTHDAAARLQQQDRLLRALPIDRPPNYDWLLDQVTLTLAALAPATQVPCHLGAIASNVMLGPEGAVLLVDFDQAGLSEPLHDLGILLTETFDFEDEWLAALQPLYGEATPQAVNRARLWGLVDDLTWGQWALICHARGQRPEIEYFKYASWRFLRATQTAGAWEFERRLRQL
ncbi:MAG: phosphotransferase [Pseudomonadota bacterium]